MIPNGIHFPASSDPPRMHQKDLIYWGALGFSNWQCTEQFALQLRYSRDRPVSKMATLPIGAIATLDAFKKSASTI